MRKQLQRFDRIGRSVAVLALVSMVGACTPLQPLVRRRGRPSAAASPAAPPLARPSPAPEARLVSERPLWQRLALPSGLEVLVQPSRASQLVSVQAWVRAGAGDDPDGQEGLAHFFEHMLFRATEKRPVGQIAREIEQAGGDLNARTTHDQTVFHIVLPRDELATAFDVLADALVRKTLDDQEVERERTVILEEIRRAEADPARRMAQLLFAAVGKESRYAQPIVGTQKTVKAIKKEQLIEFYRKYYVPSNLVLVVVGNVSPNEVKELALQRLGSLAQPAGDGLKAAPRARDTDAAEAARTQTQPRVILDERSGPLRLGIAFPGVPLLSEDAAALDLLAVLLGRGEAARLLRHLRDEEELVTQVDAWAHTPRQEGLFVVEASPTSGQLLPTLAELGEELFRLRHERITQAELDRARTLLEAGAVYQRETVEGQARMLGTFEVLASDAGEEARYRQRLAELTPAMLQEIAAFYLDPNLSTIAVLGKTADDPARLRATWQLAAARAEERYGAPPHPVAGKGAGKQLVVEKRGEVTRATFPSGMRLLVLPDHTTSVVAARALWLGGQRLEDDRTAGIHHLLAQLITRGTRTRTAEQIATELDTLAASLSGVAGQNSFSVELEVLARHWERGFEMLADSVVHPRFAESDVEREKRLLVGTLGPAYETPRRRVERTVRELLYPRHAYRFPIEGTAETVAGLGRRQLLEIHRTQLQPSQMVLAVVGDVDPERVIRKVRALFEDDPPARLRARAAPRPPPVTALPASPAPQRRQLEIERQVTWVGVGALGVSIGDPDRAALELLVAILGGQGGRLFVELRDRAALGYDVNAQSIEGLDRGYVYLSVATSVERAAEAETRLLAEIAKLKQEPPTAAELLRARRWLQGELAARLERRTALASSLAYYEAAGVGWDAHDKSRERLAAVTPEQVRRVAERLLQPGNLVVVVAQPPPPKQIAAPPGVRTSSNLPGHAKAKAKAKRGGGGGKARAR